jgi:uncharacterized protein (DUF849 family)
MEGTPVIIEVAVNGSTKKDRNRAVPVAPEEVAADALACLDAGASIVHSHIERPFNQPLDPQQSAAIYGEAYGAVLVSRPDAILYPTMAGGDTFEARWNHHRFLAERGLIRGGVVDTGSLNLTSAGPDSVPADVDWAYINSPAQIHWMFEQCRELRLGPMIACFEPGFLRTALAFHRAGRSAAGSFVKLYFAGRADGSGALFGPPPIKPAFDTYLAILDGSGVAVSWAVAVLAGSLFDTDIAHLALEHGGHLRVGIEDNSSAESNRAEVERAVALAAKHGRPVATPKQAAEILGLPQL